VTIRARLADCDALYQRALALESQIPADARDAYFQLVLYPVSGMTATNVKYLAAVEARRLAGDGSAGAAAWTERAESAWARVLADTKRYNEGVAGGKWNGIVQHDAQPRVDLKQSSLLAPVTTPSTQPMSPSAQDEKIAAHLAVDAAELLPGTAASLRKLQGLGYDDTVALLEPRTLPEVTELSQASDLPALKWTYDAPTAGTATIVVHAVPAHAPLPGGKLRCALSVNGKSTWVDFKGDDEKGRAWSSRVLLRRMSDRVDVELTSGRNEILLRPASPSVVVDAVDVLAR
jgi:hypothetical protein